MRNSSSISDRFPGAVVVLSWRFTHSSDSVVSCLSPLSQTRSSDRSRIDFAADEPFPRLLFSPCPLTRDLRAFSQHNKTQERLPCEPEGKHGGWSPIAHRLTKNLVPRCARGCQQNVGRDSARHRGISSERRTEVRPTASGDLCGPVRGQITVR